MVKKNYMVKLTSIKSHFVWGEVGTKTAGVNMEIPHMSQRRPGILFRAE